MAKQTMAQRRAAAQRAKNRKAAGKGSVRTSGPRTVQNQMTKSTRTKVKSGMKALGAKPKKGGFKKLKNSGGIIKPKKKPGGGKKKPVKKGKKPTMYYDTGRPSRVRVVK